MKESILVIGGSGFIGSNLINILYREHKVINIDKKNSSGFPEITRLADIRDLDSLRSAITKSDTVILLAAEHADNVSPISLYYDVNVEGTKNVISLCEETGVSTIIFTSTVAVYGLNKPVSTESSQTEPFNDYGRSKLQAEKLLEDWYSRDKSNRNLIVIRPTVVFGPGNRGNVYNLLKQIISGRFIMIGDGRNLKSMCYVDNIAQFIKFCICKKLSGYHLFNYVDKPDLLTKELVSIVKSLAHKKVPSFKIPYNVGMLLGYSLDVVSKVSRKKFPISSIRIKKFCSNTVYSSEHLVKTGFEAPISIKEGLKATIKSIQMEEGVVLSS